LNFNLSFEFLNFVLYPLNRWWSAWSSIFTNIFPCHANFVAKMFTTSKNIWHQQTMLHYLHQSHRVQTLSTHSLPFFAIRGILFDLDLPDPARTAPCVSQTSSPHPMWMGSCWATGSPSAPARGRRSPGKSNIWLGYTRTSRLRRHKMSDVPALAILFTDSLLSESGKTPFYWLLQTWLDKQRTAVKPDSPTRNAKGIALGPQPCEEDLRRADEGRHQPRRVHGAISSRGFYLILHSVRIGHW